MIPEAVALHNESRGGCALPSTHMPPSVAACFSLGENTHAFAELLDWALEMPADLRRV